MKWVVIAFVCIVPIWLYADKPRVEIIEETLNSQMRMFCSKTSAQDAMQKCKAWLDQQKPTLKDRLLTSYCSEGEVGPKPPCHFRSTGEIKYILKTYRKEAI